MLAVLMGLVKNYFSGGLGSSLPGLVLGLNVGNLIGWKYPAALRA